jgi:hypothetical protein
MMYITNNGGWLKGKENYEEETKNAPATDGRK